MSNFVTEFNKGQSGENRGLPLGEGLETVSQHINGLQKGRIYGLAAPPKAGKSTLADSSFVIEPALFALANSIPFFVNYFSYEIDRISKEFEYAAHFLYRDHGIYEVPLDKQLKKGKKSVIISPDYLRGRISSDDGKPILVNPDVKEKLKQVYEERIIQFFGEHTVSGLKIKPGIINMFEERENPTGLYKHLLNDAEKHGKIAHEMWGSKKIPISYTPHDPKSFHLVITDHMRKLTREQGFSLKETVDKYSEYSTKVRNLCGYSFVHIIHMNRNLSEDTRLKYAGDKLYPTPEDVKDTGNLSEDVDYLFTMFNPNDDRYRLSKHFGLEIKRRNNSLIYPDMRTLHLVESRHVSYPMHFRVNMDGAVKRFYPFVD